MIDRIASHYRHFSNFSTDTLYLYLFLFCITAILGFFAYKAKPIIMTDRYWGCQSGGYIKKEYFYALFILLFLISGFRSIGTDYDNYKRIFVNASSSYKQQLTIEPIFFLFNKIISYSGATFEVAILIFSFATILLVFKAIESYNGRINITLAIIAYISLYYLPSFNMLRMYLAASISLFSFKYLLFNKEKLFWGIAICNVFVHYSSVVFIFSIVGLLLYEKFPKLYWVLYFVVAIGLFKIASMFSELFLIERYAHYANEVGESDKGFGMLHWIINIPLLALYFYAKRYIKKSIILDALLVLVSCEFLIGMLSYKIDILGRSLVYYNVLFIIIIPILINKLTNLQLRWGIPIEYLYVFYLFYRFYLYLTEYLYLDGIMPYKSILS